MGGYYGCCCCCWNVTTKSIPLDQITDMELVKGCLQAKFGIDELQLQTPSSGGSKGCKGKSEMALFGAVNSEQLRKTWITMKNEGPGAVIPGGGQNYGGADHHQPGMGPEPEHSTKDLVESKQRLEAVLVDIRDEFA